MVSRNVNLRHDPDVHVDRRADRSSSPTTTTKIDVLRIDAHARFRVRNLVYSVYSHHA